MNNKKTCRDLMTRILQAHQEFSKVWTSIRTAELQKHNLTPNQQIAGREPREIVYKANGVAYRTAEPQERQRDELLYALYQELPIEAFGRGDPEAIDTMIDFFEVDIPAFHCGYIKERCLHRLKSMNISPSQRQRLQQWTLTLCHSKGYRRELRYLARLMIRQADQQLLQELLQSTEQKRDVYVAKKARMVMQIVLNSRPDLKLPFVSQLR